MEGAKQAIYRFADFIENNKGWWIIQNHVGQTEKCAQLLFYCRCCEFFANNNLDLSCEPNAGPGPADFKISRGNDKALIEVKLSSNPQCRHGYESQIWRYAKAEGTENMILLLLNVGNDRRVKNLQKLHEQRCREGKLTPELIIINAKEQLSASRF
jgi:hypothetical protein